jgi:Histidine kinase-, DNA gyrase B-, and HSP90-like ATPase
MNISTNIYNRKNRWKWILLLVGAVIIFLSFFYTNKIVKKIAFEERTRIEIWAQAIRQKAQLVNYTDQFFKVIQKEERKRVKLWAKATEKLIYANNNEDISFYSDIIAGNTTIPVVLTNEENRISGVKNVDFSTDSIKYLEGDLLEEFSKYEPIIVDYGFDINYLYYKESQLFSGLREVLDDLIESFFSEVTANSSSAPVIVTDSTRKNLIAFGNIDTTKIEEEKYISSLIESMESQNEPIVINLADKGKSYIYYKDSYLLTQLKYYPIFQLIIIGLFIFIAYVLFSTARRHEQNQVWVGMAKETAHQLGTPISSIIAWLELIKIEELENNYTKEIAQDLQKLERITDRFSKIGSTPKLVEENIINVTHETLEYLKARSSKKVVFSIISEEKSILTPINKHLFEWVIENICKNAIDAMEGVGSITISLIQEKKHVFIDIKDTGKGIPKSIQKNIFNPGFTSKKRGWGLGLSLSERIIKHYHKGKIYVKQSVINKGTTFRIVLNK